MEGQIQQDLNSEKPKRKYWKFVAGFLGIIIIAFGGFFVWEKYFSPQAKINRETQKNYEKYLEWQKNYEKAMREDTYGGKTPEETLQMFIEALKKGDIELASKYFALNTNEKSEYYLTRKEWEEGLQKIKDEGKLKEVISQLAKTKLVFKDESGALFKKYDSKGEVEVLVEIKLNKYSGVWKIESL